jgi:hypothetical protein
MTGLFIGSRCVSAQKVLSQDKTNRLVFNEPKRAAVFFNQNAGEPTDRNCNP